MIRGLVDWEMWGAAPRPGREKFSLHPRHVRWTCLKDVAVESNGYAFTHSGLPVALAARSVAVEGLSLRACTLRFLFSVLRGAKRPFPAPAGTSDGRALTAYSDRREPEGGGRGQRWSRRATDGAQRGSRLLLRLCGRIFPGVLRAPFRAMEEKTSR